MYRSILTYLDRRVESSYGLERAIVLARACDARLHLLRVLEPFDDAGWLFSDDPMARQVRDGIAEENRVELERHLRTIYRAGVQATVSVRWGTPFLEIIREVVEGGHDLVVKTATRRGEYGPYALGSTAMHLVRKCPCPVWVKVPRPSPSGSIVAVIDPSLGSGAQDAFNRRVVSAAAGLARALGGTLDVIRVWDSVASAGGRAVRDGSGELERRALAAARRDLEQALSCEGRTLAEERTHLVRGRAVELLPRMVSEEGFDVVVMGVVGADAEPGILVAETTEAVLQRIGCSVLLLKPGASTGGTS